MILWLEGAKALPDNLFSRAKNHYPKTHNYIDRFKAVLQASQSTSPKPTRLDGAAAAKQILSSQYAEEEGDVLSTDPQQLRKGDRVELFPTDSGFNNKDHGELLRLNDQEIVILLENGLRLHTPRTGFRVRRIGSKL